MKKRRFDAIVTFTPLPYGFIGMVVSKVLKKPFHIGIIGEKIFSQLQTCKKSLVWAVLQSAGSISVPSKRFRERLIELGFRPEKVFVLPHGITPDFHPGPIAEKEYDAIFVGDLIPVKQVHLIIEVWKEVVKKNRRARLCIVGDGAERPRLEKLVATRHLSKNIIFVGFTREVARYLRKSKLFILASKSEGLPFAMIEAMACGVTQVANNVGEISTLLRHYHNGLCLKSEVDIAEYSENIVNLLGNPEMIAKLSDNAVRSVAHLTYASVTEVWSLILDRLIQ